MPRPAAPRTGPISTQADARPDDSDMLPANLFDHLKPVAKVYEHVMHGVHIPVDNPKPVVLHLKFCGRGTPYWNAVMKFKALADEKEATKRAAERFAALGIAGWKNVEQAGQPVPYTSELGAFVLSQLVDADRPEKVDLAIAAAMSPDNFTETPAPEAGELGKK